MNEGPLEGRQIKGSTLVDLSSPWNIAQKVPVTLVQENFGANDPQKLPNLGFPMGMTIPHRGKRFRFPLLKESLEASHLPTMLLFRGKAPFVPAVLHGNSHHRNTKNKLSRSLFQIRNKSLHHVLFPINQSEVVKGARVNPP